MDVPFAGITRSTTELRGHVWICLVTCLVLGACERAVFPNGFAGLGLESWRGTQGCAYGCWDCMTGDEGGDRELGEG